jgi:drug/metabolite transporter (DMT)-like permease
MGALWLKEPMGPRQVAGLLLGMGGVVVLVGWSPVPVSGRMVLDAAAVLAASVCYAYAGIYAKRRLAELPAAALALGQQLGAAAWLVVPAVLTAPAAMPSSRAMLALAALATVSTAFAYLLYIFLISRIGPTRTPTVAYLIPVFGLLWGVLFLGESITAGMMVGMGCILVSMVLVNGVPVSGLRWQARSSAMGVVRRTDAG